MADAQPATSVVTPIGTMSFPNLFTPRAVGNGEPRYSTALIFLPEDQKDAQMTVLKNSILACAKENFGPSVSPQSLRMPFRRTSENKHFADFPEGSIYIQPWSKKRPGLVDVSGAAIDVIERVWAGQRSRLSVKPFSYSNQGNKGVSLSLENVKVVREDCPRLDGHVSAEEAFKNFDDTPDMFNDQNGVEDADIPFMLARQGAPHFFEHLVSTA